MIVSIESRIGLILRVVVAIILLISWWISLLIVGYPMVPLIDIILAAITFAGFIWVHETIHVLIVHLLGGKAVIFEINMRWYGVWRETDWPAGSVWRDVLVEIAPFLVTFLLFILAFLAGLLWTVIILLYYLATCYDDLSEVFQLLRGRPRWYNIPFD